MWPQLALRRPLPGVGKAGPACGVTDGLDSTGAASSTGVMSGEGCRWGGGLLALSYPATQASLDGSPPVIRGECGWEMAPGRGWLRADPEPQEGAPSKELRVQLSQQGPAHPLPHPCSHLLGETLPVQRQSFWGLTPPPGPLLLLSRFFPFPELLIKVLGYCFTFSLF